MTRFFLYLVSWFDPQLAAVTAAKHRAERARVRAERSAADIHGEVKRAVRKLAELETQLTYYKELLTQADQRAESLERLVQTEREKNQVHETTINTLAASNNLHLARYRAETAIEVAKRTLAAPGRVE